MVNLKELESKDLVVTLDGTIKMVETVKESDEELEHPFYIQFYPDTEETFTTDGKVFRGMDCDWDIVEILKNPSGASMETLIRLGLEKI